MITETELINAEIRQNAGISIDDIVKIELDEWLNSKERIDQVTGIAYYRNKTDILKKTTRLKNRSNIKKIHAYTKKLTDQKVGYLLSLPLSITTKDDAYQEYLDGIFNKDFLNMIKNVGKDSITAGKAWIQVYIDEHGEIAFQRHMPYEIKPLWKDADHRVLDGLIHVYNVIEYVGKQKETITKVDYWSAAETRRYNLKSGNLQLVAVDPHFYVNSKGYCWNRVPWICFKYNDEELGVVHFIKSLIDDYDRLSSKNSDLLADLAMIIYILKGYGDTDLDKFIKDLEEYLAVNIEDLEGGLDTLQVKPETDATEASLTRTRDDIFDFGMGVDTQKDSLGNASGVSMKFRFGDLDMDCNTIESEYQCSFEDIEWFIKQYLYLTGKGNFLNEDAQVLFNRDIIVNETEIIEMCAKSKGIISDQTIMENHPWAAEDEAERMENERGQLENDYTNQIVSLNGGDGDGTEE